MASSSVTPGLAVDRETCYDTAIQSYQKGLSCILALAHQERHGKILQTTAKEAKESLERATTLSRELRETKPVAFDQIVGLRSNTAAAADLKYYKETMCKLQEEVHELREKEMIANNLAKELKELKDRTTCPVCLDDQKEKVFRCGHSTCNSCSRQLVNCPVCRNKITWRIQMY